MDLHEAICPKCGGPSKDGDLCGKCLAGDLAWYVCDPRVFIVRCGGCGSLKTSAGWGDSTREREDLEEDAAASAIKFHQDVKRPSISVKLDHLSINRTYADLTIKGTLYGESLEGFCSLEVVWQNESCDRCNRQHGNYYEGVVQIRAEGRKATIEEQEEAQRIAVQVETSMQNEGERLSFISRFDEGREGLDIVVGSQAIGEQISREVTRRLGGRFSLHPTLVGEKNGHKLYRITYLVRLPRLQRGDVIAVRNTYGEILQTEGKTLTYLDLRTGLPKTIPETVPARYIAHVRDAKIYTVIYEDGNMLGVLDSETGVTEEISRVTWRHPDVGDAVKIIRDGDRIIVV
jgi:nonsense-mediated mRNA decay protein 3